MTAAISAAVIGVGGGIYGANRAASAAGDAAGTQAAASQAGIDEQRRQFDAIQKLLSPYVQAGTGALAGQQNLIGLNGMQAQQDAISALQATPMYTSALQTGEESILANASATGGLRGGNTQAALAQFSPALLSSMIQNQYANLGGLTSLGQNAAAGVGNAGLSTGGNIAGLLGQQGAAIAGGQLARGALPGDIASAISGGLGLYAGLGGFGGSRSPTTGIGTAGGQVTSPNGAYNFSFGNNMVGSW